MSPPTIISVIGSLTLDQIFTTPRIPGRGESVAASEMTVAHAGKGANMAVAAHRASRPRPGGNVEVSDPEIRVFMNGAVGSDDVGLLLRSGLEAQGIDVSGVKIADGQRTGTAVIMREEGKDGAGTDSRGLGFKGANASFGPPTEGLKGLAAGNLPDVVIMHLTMKWETVVGILEMAETEGVEIVLCASPAVNLPSEVYKVFTHLLMNEHEAAVLAGVESLVDSLGVRDDVLRKVAGSFIEQGAKNVVITLGEAGAYYATHTGEEGRVLAVTGVKVVDTTGAGDTFVGAYTADYIRQKQRSQWSIRLAVEFANRAAAQSVMGVGAQTAMPYLDEI